MRIFFSILFAWLSLQLWAQTKFNIELQSHIDFGEQGSGIWGYTDKNGIEYAVLGTNKSIRLISLEDPTKPIVRLTIPGVNNSWREARTWKEFIYVTTEGTDGLTIINAAQTPNNFTWKRWKGALPQLTATDTIKKAHSIYIDPKGYMYLNGHNASKKGIVICDLNEDPYNPKVIGVLNDVYVHDCYTFGDILYTADLSNGIGVYDIKDRANPKLLNRFATSSNFTHNMWSSADGKYLYSTDERGSAYLDVYDVSDPKNVKLLDKYRNEDSNTAKVIPHNVYALGNYAVTSWYTDGIIITDMTRPDNIVKVGEFDTYTNEATLANVNTWFFGDWGVYPYFKSGTLIGSDLESGFWVMKPAYQRAAYLEGKCISRTNSGDVPISGATIKILGTRVSTEVTNPNGIYKNGTGASGTYDVIFTHPNYPTQLVYVPLIQGEVTNLDFIFESTSGNGNVLATDGIPIKNAVVEVIGKKTIGTQVITVEQHIAADVNGKYKFSTLADFSYTIVATAWGYLPKQASYLNANTSIDVKLEKGYYDDFISDLGWKITSKAAAGNWELAKPSATFNNNLQATPSKDNVTDFGEKAYLTGGTLIQNDFNDVDGGTTQIESPIMDFTTSDTAKIALNTWFFNVEGKNAPNDFMTLRLTNGKDTIVLEKIITSSSLWESKKYTVTKNNIAFTNNMRVIVGATDIPSDNLVEAGIDVLKISLASKSTSTIDFLKNKWELTPTLATNFININQDSSNKISGSIYDIVGGKVKSIILQIGENTIDVSMLKNGSYIVKIDNGETNKMFIKINN
jgi:choice-of-anchor B domain-containing protein